MAPAAQHVVPDDHSGNPTQQAAAKLLRTSANPLDTPSSAVRPPTSTAAAPPIAEDVAHELPNGSPNGGVVDVERFYGQMGRAFRPSGITSLICEFAGLEDVVGLHGGLPPAAAFPIAGMSLRMADGGTIDIDEPKLVEAMQQYNTSASGYEPLRRWAEEHMREMHAPPTPHDVIMTTGSNHACDLVLQLLLDRGDPLLVEEFSYSHLLEGVCEPHGYESIGVPMDRHGYVPAALRQVLEGRRAQPHLRQPKVLFTVPVGDNPTGLVMPEARKREIYALACDFDLLILEDDPYYALQFRNGDVPGLRDLGASFLRLDTAGRVVRFESASKFLAPGFRVGWAALPPPLARKLEMAEFASCLGATPFSQVTLSEVLKAWGRDGLEKQVKLVQREYWSRASTMYEAARKELAGLAECEAPQAGMFLWLRLLRPPADEAQLIAKMREHRVVMVPGRISHARGREPGFQCPYLRVCWAYCKFEDLTEGMTRLAAALRDCLPPEDA